MVEKLKVPELRFKKFNGEWKCSEFEHISSFSKGRGYSKNDLIGTGVPIILYGRLYTKYQSLISDVDTFALAKSNSVYSIGNEVIIPASGETAEDIARASAIKVPGIILGGDLNIIYPHAYINSLFLALTLSHGHPQKELSKKAQGKSVVHLHNSDFNDISISYPTKQEQTKIGTFFQQLDNRITLQQRKCDKLKNIKKSMLEKMFPKEGSNVPEIRFAGFTEPWEVFELNNYIEVSNEKNSENKFSKQDVLSVSGNFGIINQIKFQGRSFAGASVSNYGVVNNGDIVYTKSPLKLTPFGIIKSNKGEAGIVSTLYAVYKPKIATDSNFVQCYFESNDRLNRYLNPLVNKGAKNDMKISSNNALRGLVRFPQYQEQKSISKYFHKLDLLISTQSTKLEKLKNIKKSFLEKMFI